VKSLSIAVQCGLVLIISASAFAQTPAEIFQEMDKRKRARISDVSNLSKMSTTLGHCTLEYFEQETTTSSDGRGSVAYMRLVPLSEVMERKNPDAPLANASAGELDKIAKELKIIGPKINTAIEVEMMSVGLPPGLGELLTTPPSDQPWLSPMPGDMMVHYAMMLEGAAEGKRKDAKEKEQAEQEANTDPLAAAAASTRVVGRETVRDRPAFHLLANNLNYTQITGKGGRNEQEFTMNSLHLWVDADRYVPLKMQVDGEARKGSESRALRIEREDIAYRTVPGCGSMYEPQRNVMRIAGILTPEEEAKMAEAQVQLEQFKAQMANMPEAQRAMIMRQMGPQMEMFQSMASGQGIEVVSLVTGMKCNAGYPTDQEYMQTAPGASGPACIGFGESGGPAGGDGSE
jgi:hypothetical protein